jgi:fumarate reductase iron-sulfur subunit
MLAHLPLVLPHGDLRQLRDDGRRRAEARLQHVPARLRAGPLRIEALHHFPIERDLVVDASDFIEKFPTITPWIVPREPRLPTQGEYLQTPRELARFEHFSHCINCMLCYAACPQYGMNPKFLGPALTALAHRYNVDSRDAGAKARRELLNSEEGVWSCTAVGYCSEVCPKGVDPANAVNQNKTQSAVSWFTRFLERDHA